MKKNNWIALAITCCFALLMKAQPTITLADLPQAGYTYVVYTDTTPSVSLGIPGATAQNWNYSSLGNDYPSLPTYGPTTSTPYASVFPASNIYTYGPAALYSSLYGAAPVNANGLSKGYMFWKTDVAGFWIIGFRADSGNYSNHNVFENPRELLIGTPATYGTTFNNSGRWQLDMNLNTADVDTYYVSTVTKTLTADAHGSLTIPSGTYSPVLRVHEYAIKVDSAYAKFGSVQVYAMELSRDTLNNYMYLDNGTTYPLCIVHADKNNLISSVEHYVSKFIGTESYAGNADQARLFPNPVTDQIRIELPSTFETAANIEITVYDNTGIKKSNKKETAHNGFWFSDLPATLPAGVYLLRISDQKRHEIQTKFTVIK